MRGATYPSGSAAAAFVTAAAVLRPALPIRSASRSSEGQFGLRAEHGRLPSSFYDPQLLYTEEINIPPFSATEEKEYRHSTHSILSKRHLLSCLASSGTVHSQDACYSMHCTRLVRLPVAVQHRSVLVSLAGTTSLPSEPSLLLRHEGAAARKMSARHRRAAAAAATNSANGASGKGSRLAEELVGEVEEQVEQLEKRTGCVWGSQGACVDRWCRPADDLTPPYPTPPHLSALLLAQLPVPWQARPCLPTLPAMLPAAQAAHTAWCVSTISLHSCAARCGPSRLSSRLFGQQAEAHLGPAPTGQDSGEQATVWYFAYGEPASSFCREPLAGWPCPGCLLPALFPPRLLAVTPVAAAHLHRLLAQSACAQLRIINVASRCARSIIAVASLAPALAGSNMNKKVFSGRRMIKPAASLPAVLPGWRLTFSQPGLPYAEPGFAAVERQPAAAGDGDGAQGDGAPQRAQQQQRQRPDVHGVLHHITESQWRYVLETEGASQEGNDDGGYAVVTATAVAYDGHEVPGVKTLTVPARVKHRLRVSSAGPRRTGRRMGGTPPPPLPPVGRPRAAAACTPPPRFAGGQLFDSACVCTAGRTTLWSVLALGWPLRSHAWYRHALCRPAPKGTPLPVPPAGRGGAALAALSHPDSGRGGRLRA